MKEAFDRNWIGVPDWGVGIAAAISIVLWLWLFWSHEEVKKRRYLLYAYPKMGLALFIIGGALLGAVAFGVTRAVAKHALPPPPDSTGEAADRPVKSETERQDGSAFKETTDTTGVDTYCR